MQDFLFYLISMWVLVCGALVVVNPFSRNPVTSAMFLVLTMLALAGLFVLLHAFFLAAVQILVYAGAVMVVFLFIIMLLDLRIEARRRVSRFSLVVSLLAIGGIAFAVFGALGNTEWSSGSNASGLAEGTTEPLGRLLLRDYLLPVEILSVLLLVAMVGVIVLSKRNLERPESRAGS